LAKHPELSKIKLREIVSNCKNLFNVVNDQVSLCQLDSKFARNYFDLAEGVEVIQQMNNSRCLNSSSETFQIGFGNSICVTGLLCALSVSPKGKAVLFQFDGHTTYRLENPLPINNIENHKFAKSTLRIRKNIVNNTGKKIMPEDCWYNKFITRHFLQYVSLKK
jgi:hypothetical protein